MVFFFFFSSRRRHTRCALVTGVQTCALPISLGGWATRPPFRPVWRRLSGLPAATALQGLALWIWHAPSAFQAALGSDLIHFAEHATMPAAALLFWWVLARSGDPARPGLGAGALCALVTLVHCGFLGALITFAPTPLYPAYGDSAAEWGLPPLEDQQLAGLIMWIPGGCRSEGSREGKEGVRAG